MRGANCFHVQDESGGKRKYCSNGRNDAAVQNINEEVREVTRYD